MKKNLLILFLTIVSVTSWAQSRKANLKDKLALQGYDPVAYFVSNKAVQGDKAITADYNEARYHFASENNKALFLANPSQYEPQFGGYCAYGMSNGYEAPIQPEAFTVVDNKLYLNYNLKVKEMWLKDQAARIEKATENWERKK